jgi:hypothetical protein
MRFRCGVIETIVIHRIKDVIVEADSAKVVVNMQQFIRDNAADMTDGWREDQERLSNVIIHEILDPDNQKDEDFIIKVMNPSTEEVKSADRQADQ